MVDVAVSGQSESVAVVAFDLLQKLAVAVHAHELLHATPDGGQAQLVTVVAPRGQEQARSGDHAGVVAAHADLLHLLHHFLGDSLVRAVHALLAPAQSGSVLSPGVKLTKLHADFLV